MERWQYKVAVVTGASAGIGAAICKVLVESGLKVVGLARRKERIEKLSKSLENESGKLYAVKADITKEEDICNAFTWISDNVGTIHVLINNAGIFRVSDLLDGQSEAWKSTFDTNVIGLCIATREAAKRMKENNIDGHIIHINSVAGHKVPLGVKGNVYSASKYAVTALTESLRLELNLIQSKIKITSISPGFVKTEFLEDSGMPTTMFEGVPYLEAKDVADSVRYVLSTPPHVQIHELIIKPIGEPY